MSDEGWDSLLRLGKTCCVEFTISSRGGFVKIWHPFENRRLIREIAEESHCKYHTMRAELREPCPYLENKLLFHEQLDDYGFANLPGDTKLGSVMRGWQEIWNGVEDAAFWQRLRTFSRRLVKKGLK
jgi:hypothetical protein